MCFIEAGARSRSPASPVGVTPETSSQEELQRLVLGVTERRDLLARALDLASFVPVGESRSVDPCECSVMRRAGPLSDYGTLSGSRQSLSTVACSVRSDGCSSVADRDDSAYGAGADVAAAAPDSEDERYLLCPEDFMPPQTDSSEEDEDDSVDPLGEAQGVADIDGFKWTLYPDEAYVDPYKEDSESDSDTRSIIITHVLPAAEVERRRRLFAGILIDLD
jgi:hypothetical protein